MGEKTKWLKMKEAVKTHVFPPTGSLAVFLSLLVSTVAVFLVARCVLGSIAAMGGTVFALMVLIVLLPTCKYI